MHTYVYTCLGGALPCARPRGSGAMSGGGTRTLSVTEAVPVTAMIGSKIRGVAVPAAQRLRQRAGEPTMSRCLYDSRAQNTRFLQIQICIAHHVNSR